MGEKLEGLLRITLNVLLTTARKSYRGDGFNLPSGGGNGGKNFNKNKANPNEPVPNRKKTHPTNTDLKWVLLALNTAGQHPERFGHQGKGWDV